MYKIAVVVGGTNTNLALFRNSTISKRKYMKTRAEEGIDVFIQRLISNINEIIKNKTISGIGLGVPGFIDTKKGILKKSILSSSPIFFKKILKKELETNVFLENDAKCAALGLLEKEKIKNFVLLTIGTGIGGGIVINGELMKGRGNSGEFGHMTVKTNGVKCTCGNNGCLQQYAAKPAFRRLSKKYFKKIITPEKLYKMAKEGNKKANLIYDEVGKWLGVGMANISNCFDPEFIFLTGKITKSGNLLINPAKEEMKKRVFVDPSKVKILKKNYELFGAASLIRAYKQK